MKTLRWLLAGVVVGAIAVTLKDRDQGSWLRSLFPERPAPVGPEEPVLGYDGMDQETLIDWISTANLDSESLDRILRYEEANLNREPVLDLLDDLLD